MNRTQMADVVAARLEKDFERLRKSWLASGPIYHFTVDDLLPVEVAQAIRAAYPQGDSMKIKRSLRELKFIAAQMNQYDSLLE
jgi:hypothetical protein